MVPSVSPGGYNVTFEPCGARLQGVGCLVCALTAYLPRVTPFGPKWHALLYILTEQKSFWRASPVFGRICSWTAVNEHPRIGVSTNNVAVRISALFIPAYSISVVKGDWSLSCQKPGSAECRLSVYLPHHS